MSTTAPHLPSPVLIIGTGLIGGSLGLALGPAGVTVHVQDVSPGTTSLAVELGVGRPRTEEDAPPALVLVAAPPDVAASLVADALHSYPEALVVDVASVKRAVLESLRGEVSAGRLTEQDLTRYVGAHPMAGREVSGVIAARADLFLGRPFVICPHEGTERRDIAVLQQIAAELGSLPVVMEAARHDEAVARVSHAPQVLASLLATGLLEADEQALELAGQGLRDTTRIAASDPRLWVEILGANARALRPVLQTMGERLEGIQDALRTMEADPDPGVGSRRRLASLIADGNRGVHRIPGKHGSGTDTFTTVSVMVPDSPGELARLLTETGQIGVNLEDLHLEHSLGQRVGVAHIAVIPSHEDLLTRELAARGWSVLDG
ncbi:prephenate dehydrogenase [Brachybacterium endophyticum]|uniref:Prephenate dehydrogenase n=1 Tax=Brachybacterium endophyticum TaxID=2182385 RepID=A0A2U2RIY2_9MICO|nr:prephenate dehydrogenase [Brachybacterium endophyticum]PWH05755.1 prephenate dehydrogenase [Brachybacterium endophyticum]